MRTKSTKPMFRTLIGWTDPTGVQHLPGAVEELDPVKIFDLGDLLAGGTIEPAPEQPDVVPDVPGEDIQL